MIAAVATVNGLDLQRCELHIPQAGVPWADVVFAEATTITSPAVLRFGSLSLTGTVDPRYSGAFGAARSARIVAGAGSWGHLLPPRDYHSDSGVAARLVALDAARECGETLGDFTPGATTLGQDWTRAEGPASAALEAAAGGVPWWVGLDGVTRVGLRAEVVVTGEYALLTYSPQSRIATLTASDPATIGIGSIITDRLAEPGIVREIEYSCDGDKFEIQAWLGGDARSDCRLHDALGKWHDREHVGRLWGIYRYRVTGMADRRVRLQAVSVAAGLPDQIAVRQRPGLPGCSAILPAGAEVLIQFVAGLPSDPVLTGYAPMDDPSAEPTELDLGGDDVPVAFMGGAVATFIPVGTVLAGVVVAGSSGSLTVANPVTLTGQIQDGSGVVKVAR